MSEGLKRESEEWRSDNQLLTTKFEFFSSVRTLARDDDAAAWRSHNKTGD